MENGSNLGRRVAQLEEDVGTITERLEATVLLCATAVAELSVRVLLVTAQVVEGTEEGSEAQATLLQAFQAIERVKDEMETVRDTFKPREPPAH